jgi:hypothetical protein
LLQQLPGLRSADLHLGREADGAQVLQTLGGLWLLQNLHLTAARRYVVKDFAGQRTLQVGSHTIDDAIHLFAAQRAESLISFSLMDECEVECAETIGALACCPNLRDVTWRPNGNYQALDLNALHSFLTSCKRLQMLDVSDMCAPLEPAAICMIASSCPELRCLDLADNHTITDACVAAFCGLNGYGGCPLLEDLELGSSFSGGSPHRNHHLSDAALRPLCDGSLPRLCSLGLVGCTCITQRIVDRLKLHRPALKMKAPGDDLSLDMEADSIEEPLSADPAWYPPGHEQWFGFTWQ